MLRQIVAGVVGIGLLWAFVHWARDPHRTALPFGSTDLSSVESALRRLPAEERRLVEAYVKRSNGDFLPPKFADPDEPFTARTFAEAIVLQQRWEVQVKAMQAKADAMAAQREAAMEPLREAVEARLIKAELVSERDWQQRFDQPEHRVKSALASNERALFIVTVGVYNHTATDVARVTGSLHAKDRDHWMQLDLCWIDAGRNEAVPAVGHIEFQCANTNRTADARERVFVDEGLGDRFTLQWEPHTVEFADGRKLDAKL
jgi:hypothetical protein